MDSDGTFQAVTTFGIALRVPLDLSGFPQTPWLVEGVFTASFPPPRVWCLGWFHLDSWWARHLRDSKIKESGPQDSVQRTQMTI